MKYTSLHKITNAIADNDKLRAIIAIDGALISETGPDWIEYLGRLKRFIDDGAPRFTIVSSNGNGKLPFAAFSSLPGKRFCPGAGDCLSKCYSFKAWRQPAAFCRQAQNTILLNTKDGRDKIVASFKKVIAMRKYNNAPVFRLYVDGDFRSQSDIRFWFDLLAENPQVKAYGYSKSFSQLLQYSRKNSLPDNYKLNISGGHKHAAATINKVNQLAITRGAFTYIDMAEIKIPAGEKHHTRAQVQREFIAKTGEKAFVCPGQCGDCVKVKGENSHFCGSDSSVPVVIAMH